MSNEKVSWDKMKWKYMLKNGKIFNLIENCYSEMNNGLICDNNSSLKMLESHVYNLPNSNVNGTYYGIDWGGSNVRIIRMHFKGFGDTNPDVHQIKFKIPNDMKTCDNPDMLFDYIAKNMYNEMKKFNEIDGDKIYSVGFCFSFPIKQVSLKDGILLKWTKGFNVGGTVNKNITDLMDKAFAKYNLPCKIDAIINDTVGTLISSAFYHNNVRIGVIVGTGTNAAYIEPKNNNEIINIEWGNFNKELPIINETDGLMDTYTAYPGSYLAEKMISGHYIGEIVRLILLQLFGERIIKYGKQTPLNIKFSQNGVFLTRLLKFYMNNDINSGLKMIQNEYSLTDFNKNDIELIMDVCRIITHRSADICCSFLIAVMIKTGFLKRTDNTNQCQFILNDDYNGNDIKIGIDGGVYHNNPCYKPRLRYTLTKMVGMDISDKIKIVHAQDGSGIGAVLVVAALKQKRSKL